eukprot:scaffold8741_cov142-Skeletonema_menzelii.AAC.2
MMIIKRLADASFGALYYLVSSLVSWIIQSEGSIIVVPNKRKKMMMLHYIHFLLSLHQEECQRFYQTQKGKIQKQIPVTTLKLLDNDAELLSEMAKLCQQREQNALTQRRRKKVAKEAKAQNSRLKRKHEEAKAERKRKKEEAWRRCPSFSRFTHEGDSRQWWRPLQCAHKRSNFLQMSPGCP